MRTSVLVILMTAALGACSPSAPPAAPSPAPQATPAPGASAGAAAAPDAETPPAAPKPVPVGVCGDQSKLPPDQRVANTARWTTASEQNSFGFDVYRGDSEKGEFKKLTKEPIGGAGSSDETHQYEFRDDSIDPCRDYWYYVESISTNGTREKFTPTFKAAAKRSPKAAPTP